MKLAITGKGGVGKTTLSSTLARLYAAEGRPVLAADVDPDANLGLALGMSQEGDLPFVQEVFASAQAVRKHYPHVDAAIELGGEDAKIGSTATESHGEGIA